MKASPPRFSKEDERFMRRALTLAVKARGRCSPNPMVGTVVVKGSKIIGEGFHRQAGLPHAEVEALSPLGGKAPGATLYVNLEPCDHEGRTGPCTRALLGSGVKRGGVGMIDPNTLVNGRGLRGLRAAGIRVDTGLLEAESRRVNEGFVSVMERERPFLALKLAATLDGRIAPRRGGGYITGSEARARVHGLRAWYDAVLVGAGTVEADDPALTVRLAAGRDPLRVVVDSRARISPEAKLFREGHSKVVVATTDAAPASRVRALETAGAQVMVVPAKDGRVDLSALLRALVKRGVLTVLCEGGATLGGALFDAGLVDKLYVFYAP